MEENLFSSEKLDITIARKVYDETCFTSTSRPRSATKFAKKEEFLNAVYRKLSSCKCTANGLLSVLIRLAPIVRWLPKYSVKKDLTADITGGVTVGIMHIPQGNIKTLKERYISVT